MSQRVKRVFNAFGIGFLTALAGLALEHWLDLTNAVQVGDWISLKQLAISVGFGAIGAAIRAVQAAPAIPVPSPEPEENAAKPSA
jgi:hypothetical protein